MDLNPKAFNPPPDKYAGLRPYCDECGDEITDDEWYHFDFINHTVCKHCASRSVHDYTDYTESEE